jgi:hypothetical protein
MARHQALGHPDERNEPTSTAPSGAEADPWASNAIDGYSDEPPF